MKVRVDELCPSCRKIPWGYGKSWQNGMTVEEMLNVLHNDERVKNQEDEINAALFASLYGYRDVGHCTRCRELVLDRLPEHMKRA